MVCRCRSKLQVVRLQTSAGVAQVLVPPRVSSETICTADIWSMDHQVSWCEAKSCSARHCFLCVCACVCVTINWPCDWSSMASVLTVYAMGRHFPPTGAGGGCQGGATSHSRVIRRLGGQVKVRQQKKTRQPNHGHGNASHRLFCSPFECLIIWHRIVIHWNMALECFNKNF